MRSRRASFALMMAAFTALCACSIERTLQGAQLRADPNEWIINGRTTKADVLRIFGPPERIQRQMDGDVFMYSYVRRESREISLEEPTTDIGFSYKRSEELADRLVVLFGRDGVVKGFGYRPGTRETPGMMAGINPFGGDRGPAKPQVPAGTAAVLPVPPAVTEGENASAVSAVARNP
jgi:hypothetical protein